MGSTKQYTPEYKAKLVVEVLKGESTISEIGGRESISPKQLGNWKHEFLDNAYRAFSVTKDERNAEAKAREAQQREQDLMAKIGQLTYELDWAKKNLRKISNREKKELIDEAEPNISVRRQCEILDYNRSNLYYQPCPRDSISLEYRENVMARLDYWNTAQPAWGVKKLVPLLRSEGYAVGHELIYEIMREMGLVTIYPKQNCQNQP